MKKISGNLRLDLAQYNELKAFTQFGSDLDAATKATLDRGARVMEMLKQAQYSPMPVEDQVAIIYAVSKGYTDDIAVNKIGAFEAGLLNFMKSSRSICQIMRGDITFVKTGLQHFFLLIKNRCEL